LPQQAEADLQKAISLDKAQWRFYKLLGNITWDAAGLKMALPLVESIINNTLKIISWACSMQKRCC
jgi:hypothetical protein